MLVEKVERGGEIGIEACASSHYWARELQARGFRVKLISPQFVKAYIKSMKNDVNDAEAICEAMSRPQMRFVSVKTVEQQGIQAMHRVRETLLSHRQAKANQIRGLVAEYGLVAPKKRSALCKAIPDWLEDADNGLTDTFRAQLQGLWEDLRVLNDRVKALDKQIHVVSETHPDAKRLKQLFGVGPLVSTAIVARIGDGRQFKRGRQAAASIGITPRHWGTGGRNRVYGITKRGDTYLRCIQVHGARAAVSRAKHKDDPLSRWLNELVARSHLNVAVVALAN